MEEKVSVNSALYSHYGDKNCIVLEFQVFLFIFVLFFVVFVVVLLWIYLHVFVSFLVFCFLCSSFAQAGFLSREAGTCRAAGARLPPFQRRL